MAFIHGCKELLLQSWLGKEQTRKGCPDEFVRLIFFLLLMLIFCQLPEEVEHADV